MPSKYKAGANIVSDDPVPFSALLSAFPTDYLPHTTPQYNAGANIVSDNPLLIPALLSDPKIDAPIGKDNVVTDPWSALLQDIYLIQTLMHNDNVVVNMGYTQSMITTLVTEASHELGFDFVYDDNLLDSLNLKDFSTDDYEINDSALMNKTLDEVISYSLASLRKRSAVPCFDRMSKVSNLERLKELLLL